MDNQVKEILPEQVETLIQRGEKMQIIDVREVYEWNEGHIAQAKLISLGTLPDRLNELDKSTPIIMVCRSGARSWSATEFVQRYGFEVANMTGGMLAWQGDIVKE
ncbi:rhodanese-like domain-containing protein [Brevibacillus ginsengisoli]|uniref:rhodanese-like domain-containing protein n=1 Tax=Brevibacillus ginsengisoli TaxID=363854 RepID=UPI003CF36D22